MIVSTKVERIEDKELVRIRSINEAAPATNKDIIRPLNYELLVGTHVPEPDWHRLGALVRLLFRDPSVGEVEIWRRDSGEWIANAFVAVGRGHRLRRGEGETPVEAFNRLILDIQRY